VGVDEKVDSLDARLTGKLDALAAQMGHMKGELIAEIRRLDAPYRHRHPRASRRPRSPPRLASRAAPSC
jgi:hypothetical protein